MSRCSIWSILAVVQLALFASCTSSSDLRSNGPITRDCINITYARDAFRDSRRWPQDHVTHTRYSSPEVAENIHQIDIGDKARKVQKLMGNPLASEIFHKKNQFLPDNTLQILLYSEPLRRDQKNLTIRLVGIVLRDHRVDKIICCYHGISESNQVTIHQIKKFCYEDWP